MEKTNNIENLRMCLVHNYLAHTDIYINNEMAFAIINKICDGEIIKFRHRNLNGIIYKIYFESPIPAANLILNVLFQNNRIDSPSFLAKWD